VPLDPLPIIPGIITVVPPNYFDVVASTTPSIVLPANVLRKMAVVFNDSPAVLYLKFGTGVSSTNFTVKMKAQSFFEFPIPI